MKYLKNGFFQCLVASLLSSSPVLSDEVNRSEEMLIPHSKLRELPSISTQSGMLAEKFDGAIDLAVWVQPAVIDRLNAKGVNAEQYIDEMVNAWAEKANSTMIDSGVSSEFRLVYAGVTQNVPDTAPVTDGDVLNQLSHFGNAWTTNGTIENFAMLNYSPDRTVFIVDKDTASLGFVIGSAVVGGNYATVTLDDSVSDSELNISLKTFVHELGHTLTADHEVGNAGERSDPDARAYECNGGTVMQSMNDNIDHFLFSNPAIIVGDAYCGESGVADNARAINAYLEDPLSFERGQVRNGEVSFTAKSYTVDETDGVGTVSLSRTGDLTDTAVVMLQVFDGTATYPSDFPKWQYQVEFEVGQATVDVDVAVIADAFSEGEETATLKLAYPSRADVTADTATLRINDGDSGTPGTFEIVTASSVVEGDDIEVTINRLKGSDGELVADVKIFAKTWEDMNVASYIYDYDRFDSKVVFADGETTKVITVPTIDDDEAENTEMLSVMVTSNVGVENGDVDVSLLDNENGGAYGQFTISLETSGEIEDTDGAVTLTVSRTGGDAAVEVNLEIVAGNFNSFTLAELEQSSVAFAEGEMQKTVQVILNDYTGSVSSRDVTVRLTSSTEGVVENGQQDVTFTVKLNQSTATSQQPSTGGNTGGERSGGSMSWIFLLLVPLLFVRQKGQTN